MEQYGFSADFQDLLLSCLLKHPDDFQCYGQIVEAQFFSGVQATAVAKVALQYNQEFGRFPGWETLFQLSQDYLKHIEVEDDSTNRTKDYITRLRDMDTQDKDYVVRKTVDFCRERAVVNAVRKSIEGIKEGKIPETNIVKLFESALAVGQNLDDLGWVLHAHSDQAVDAITAKGFGIRTGFPLLDNVWKNGWHPGWLIVPLAPPKRFKTACAMQLALNMISPLIHEDVLYYTCELSKELAICRALSNLSGKTMDYMYENPEKFKQACKDKFGSLVAGNLLFKDFASKSATIADIKAHAKTCIKQFDLHPKAIVIDYAETVKPSAAKDVKDYRQQADIYTEARAMGKDLGCCVIMPDRCNRETVDTAVPNMKSFQGSFEKAGIVDAAIGLCSTEDEYIQNVLRFFVFINRHGPACAHFKGSVDPTTFKISINSEIEYDPDAEEDEKPHRGSGRGNGRGRNRSRGSEGDVPDELK